MELGVKFRSEAAGFITAIRFYKGTGNTGSHIGNLWASNGTLLSSVTFSNETATGWQQASLIQSGGDHGEYDLCGVLLCAGGALCGE